MAGFKISVNTPRWLQMIRDKRRIVAGAAVGALVQVANDAVAEGKKQIAASGRFSDSLRRTLRAGPTWVTGLKARMQDAKTGGGESSLQAKAIVFHEIGLAGIFEFGATIAGKKLLWIPLNPRAPPARRSGKALVSGITVKGTPALFDAADPKRDRKPLYIGVPTVRIPKKWHIIEIVRKHFQQLGRLFLNRIKDN